MTAVQITAVQPKQRRCQLAPRRTILYDMGIIKPGPQPVNRLRCLH